MDPGCSDKDFRPATMAAASLVRKCRILPLLELGPGNAGGYGIFFEKKYHSLVMESRRVKGLDTKT